MFESYVGIDIGSGTIKLSFQEKVYEVETPVGSIENGEIKNITKLWEAIKPLVVEHKLQNKNTIIVYNGPSVFTKVTKIPFMKQKEIKNYLKLEAENIIPFSLKEGVLDYIILKTEKNSMELLVIAIKNELLTPLIKTVKLSGLQPMAIDIPGLTLARMLFKDDKIKANKEIKKGLQLVLDIGKSTTDIHIYQDSTFRFSRTISIGGDDFDNVQASLASSSNSYNPKLFKGILADLNRELVRSINYYRHRFGNQEDKFEKVFVVGGNSGVEGIKDLLQEVTKINPNIVEESKTLLVKGLVAWKQNTNINLLPLDYRPESKVNIKKLAAGVGAGLVTVWLITSFVTTRMEISSTNKMIESTKNNIGVLQNTLEVNRDKIKHLENLRDIVISIDGINSSSISHGSVLDDLKKHTPRNVQLNSLAVTAEQVTLQAQVPDLSTLALFLDSLNSWERYEKFFVSQTSFSDGRYVFSIQGHRKRGVK